MRESKAYMSHEGRGMPKYVLKIKKKKTRSQQANVLISPRRKNACYVFEKSIAQYLLPTVRATGVHGAQIALVVHRFAGRHFAAAHAATHPAVGRCGGGGSGGGLRNLHGSGRRCIGSN